MLDGCVEDLFSCIIISAAFSAVTLLMVLQKGIWPVVILL